MVEWLFLDLDNTILDFDKAEYIALGKTLGHFGLEPTEEVRSCYRRINKEHWLRLERKELTRQQVLVGRFETLFREYGICAAGEACAAVYETNLSQGHYFLPGALEALERLHKKYRLFLASNGTARVQAGRLDSANIRHYFEGIFISQEMGADKPSPDYFNSCFRRIPGIDPAKAMMVGDSLSSDILGGKNAGMLTCWINRHQETPDPAIAPDYEIESIAQLDALLESL